MSLLAPVQSVWSHGDCMDDPTAPVAQNGHDDGDGDGDDGIGVGDDGDYVFEEPSVIHGIKLTQAEKNPNFNPKKAARDKAARCCWQ